MASRYAEDMILKKNCGGRMKNSSKKKSLNGRRTKTSKRKAPKRTEKTETVNAKKENEQKVLSTNIQ